MPKHPVPVFDSDGHVYENDDEIIQYFEGPLKGVRRFKSFSLFPGLDGWSRGMILGKQGEERKYTYTDATVWGEMLDAIGADGTVLYPTAGLGIGLFTDVAIAVGTAAAYNNWMEDRYTRQDDRLYGAGMLATQDPAEAARELARCATERRGFPAMFMPSVTWTGKTFGDEFFWPIYEAAEKHDMALALHGGPSRGLGFDHWRNFAMVHALEHPFPLMIQMTDMIMSGVFDAFPKLRVAYLEAGCTWIPFIKDRLDYEFEAVGKLIGGNRCKKLPSEYIREGENIWVAVELGERGLKYAIDAMGGADRIMYASDYPHEPPEEEIIGDVPKFLADPDYDNAVKARVLGAAARRFYRLD